MDTKNTQGISYQELMTDLVAAIKENPSEYIETRLNKVLKLYVNLIKDGIYYNEEHSFYVPFDDQPEKQNGIGGVVKSCVKFTKNIVTDYLKGDLKKCQKTSSEWWYEETKEGKKALPVTKITPDEVFYRIRKQDKEFKGLHRKDLFHAPFERRGNISTNRYSVLGYPCLYLGRSIYTCWEEAHRPKLDSFFVSAIKTTQEDIKLLDFRLCRDSFSDYWDFRRYVCVLPMIIGCSLRVNMSDDKFRAEYILPQMVLHQIITSQLTNNPWEGIMFTSTQVEEDFGFSIDNPTLADNIAIPIQKNAEKGWCEVLCSKYELTEPTNYEYEILKFPVIPAKTKISVQSNEVNILQAENKEEGLSPFQLMEKRLNEREFKKIDYKTGKSI